MTPGPSTLIAKDLLLPHKVMVLFVVIPCGLNKKLLSLPDFIETRLSIFGSNTLSVFCLSESELYPVIFAPQLSLVMVLGQMTVGLRVRIARLRPC